MDNAIPLALLLEGVDADASAWMGAHGFDAPDAARRALQSLYRAIPDPAFALRFLELLLERLPASPDADRALNHLTRWVGQLTSARDTLATLAADPRLLDELLLLLGASDYLADILVREPTLYATLSASSHSPPGPEVPFAARIDAAVDLFQRPASRLDALRRFRRREFFRIAWRDLTGRDDFVTVVRAISDLTDAILAKALAICRDDLASRGTAPPPFAVIGMGKLGARELNYSSDVDLLFLCDVEPGDDRAMRSATRLAEEFVKAVSQPTAEGHLFRVDMRLRPEGRAGALVRSLASYREYYDRWMETWERQALIKARCVVGDVDLGARFEQMIEPRVYRRVHSTAIFEDVRDVKLAIERRVERDGESETNVKEGRGTIRDIEFTLQLLQLLFGGEHPHLRARASLDAMSRLTAAGLLTDQESDRLSDHYRFFRNVEHRLQLMNDLPVRVLPETAPERRKLARRMGYPSETADRFLVDYAERATAVRQITGDLIRRLAHDSGDMPSLLRELVLDAAEGSSRAGLTNELERLGFLDPPSAVDTVARLSTGAPNLSLPMATRRTFAELAETLLPCAGAAPDPEGALRVIGALARRMGTYQTFYRTLQEQSDMVAALCVVAGSSPWVAEEITRRPELMDAMTDPEFLRRERDRDDLLAEARRRRDATRSKNDRRNALCRFRKRELLRLAARDLMLRTPPATITSELSRLADVCMQVGLELATAALWPERDAPPAGFTVIGLGRLGGEEMHYSSDLDLLYLYNPAREPEPLTHAQYEALAAELSGTMQHLSEEGRLYEIDLRLRPEGKSGLMLVHLDAARQYYGPEGRSQTWEKQSLIKARCVAGDGGLAADFLAVVQPTVFPENPPPERDDEVRGMKRRIERERVRDADRARDVKLGTGGLSDIEFLAQLLQLRHGGRHPEVRARKTPAALHALATAGLLPAEDAATLADHHAFLTRLRQCLYLRSTGIAGDLVPTDPAEGRRLARMLGLTDAATLAAEHARRTTETRALFTRHFL